MAASSIDLRQPNEDDDADLTLEESEEAIDSCFLNGGSDEKINKGRPLETIVNIHCQPLQIKDMEEIRNGSSIFMISPFKYDRLNPEQKPITNYRSCRSVNQSDSNCVLMPYSKFHDTKNKQSIWSRNCQSLIELKIMCNNRTATVKDLKKTIRNCIGRYCELDSLAKLIDKVYSNDERSHFMSVVLSNICTLAVNVEQICGQPPPLLRSGSTRSVTMSQEQVASLLACSFFCLYPYRSDYKNKYKYRTFPNPNFHILYQSGHPRKIQKLKCIFNYFQRVTDKMPNGVITIQRVTLPRHLFPQWFDFTIDLCDLNLTTGRKIEDIDNVLQVDFANKYIGGGVLGSGCVQEEIRFSICPEMLVSLLLCEKMEPNECIFLIGCERYSTYQGYADSFEFAGNYDDNTPRDNWGRRMCHLVAIDAIYFRKTSTQYDMNCANRELLKAYTGFLPLEYGLDETFGIATGNWGCGAFHGDKYLKAIIQLMAASAVGRPLIYAAYRDKTLVNSFAVVYEYLKAQKATVRDLYGYLEQYCGSSRQGSLFDYILETPISSLKP